MAADPATATIGLERIGAAFGAAREEGRAALMPYMMGDFPDHDAATAIAEAYADGGADLLELGVPFSDPLADGPVIHAAGTKALAAGATLERVLETCAGISTRVPVLVMCYVNMVLTRGADSFAADLATAGGSGAIVPDLPLEEAEGMAEAFAGSGLALVPLVAPTTPPDRRARISEAATGFVYLVSDVGTTGERDELPPELAKLIEETRADAELPVAVGFGIGTPAQAAAVGQLADGVIIGSRLVRAVSEGPDLDAAVEDVTRFLRETRAALGSP